MTVQEDKDRVRELYVHQRDKLTEWEATFINGCRERLMHNCPLSKGQTSKLTQIYVDHCAGDPQ